MEFKTVKLTVDGDRAHLQLNRPAVGNAINMPLVDELRKALHLLEDEVKPKVVFLSGAGPDFCRGIDLTEFSPKGTPDIHGFNRWEKVCRTLERLPALTFAAIDGECAGGGLQLALACDIRVATDRAIFHFHDVRMGFIPGMGTFRLAKFIGLGRARRMALTGRHVQAPEALAMGLVDHQAPAAGLWRAVDDAVAEFGPINTNAVELIRRLMDESYENSWEDFLGNFLAAQDRCIRSDEFQAYVRRAHEKGTPGGED